MNVWKEMQSLGHFLYDVQPLGTMTEQFFELTREIKFSFDKTA